MQHRGRILDIWISGKETAKHKKRRVILEATMMDNWEYDVCNVFVGEHDTDEIVEAKLDTWAEQATEALLPQRLKLFARHRWVTSTECSGELTLLSLCHNVLPRAVTIWAQKLNVNKKAFQLELEEVVLEHLQDDPNSYWKAFNEKHRGQATRLTLPSTTSQILLWHKCTLPCVQLTDRCLRQASDTWDRNELHDAAQSVPRV